MLTQKSYLIAFSAIFIALIIGISVVVSAKELSNKNDSKSSATTNTAIEPQKNGSSQNPNPVDSTPTQTQTAAPTASTTQQSNTNSKVNCSYLETTYYQRSRDDATVAYQSYIGTRNSMLNGTPITEADSITLNFIDKAYTNYQATVNQIPVRYNNILIADGCSAIVTIPQLGAEF